MCLVAREHLSPYRCPTTVSPGYTIVAWMASAAPLPISRVRERGFPIFSRHDGIITQSTLFPAGQPNSQSRWNRAVSLSRGRRNPLRTGAFPTADARDSSARTGQRLAYYSLVSVHHLFTLMHQPMLQLPPLVASRCTNHSPPQISTSRQRTSSPARRNTAAERAVRCLDSMLPLQ